MSLFCCIFVCKSEIADLKIKIIRMDGKEIKCDDDHIKGVMDFLNKKDDTIFETN
jgi:hypothetical protein